MVRYGKAPHGMAMDETVSGNSVDVIHTHPKYILIELKPAIP